MMGQPSTHIAIYYHTHWDREWYQPFRMYQVRLAEVMDAILDRLETGVLNCFTLDGQTILLEDYLELRPEKRKTLTHWIQNGQLNIGPWYVMPDEWLVSGESLLRNLKRGIEMSKAWGCEAFTGYLPDTFGHSGEIPQLLQHCGISTALVWRGVSPSQSLFLWKSPDGSQVLTYFLAQGYFQNMLHDPELSREERQQALRDLVEKLTVSAQGREILIPIGGDHIGPIDGADQQLLQETYGSFAEILPPQFMAGLSEKDLTQVPVVSGELRNNDAAFLLPGVYSSRLYLKQENRRLEHQLTRLVEPLVAMVQQWGAEHRLYPTHELDLAWKLLLQNHPHDSICGCSVDEVHQENEVRFAQVRQLCEALQYRQKKVLQVHCCPDATEKDWVLYHLGARPYTGVVSVTAWGELHEPASFQVKTSQEVLKHDYLTDWKDVPQAHRTIQEQQGWIWVEAIPPLSVTRQPKATALPEGFQPAQVVAGESQGTLQLNNGILRVDVKPDGTLTVTDLKAGVSYPGLHHLVDFPDAGDSYNSAPVPGGGSQLATLKTAEVVQSGPLVATLRLTYLLAEETLTTEVSLKAGSSQVLFDTHWTNTRPDHKLQVTFETGTPITEVMAESHGGVVKRIYDPAYEEQAYMPAAAYKELVTNTGPIQRFVMAHGQLFITEGLAEYEVRGSQLCLTLLRAFGVLSKGDTGVRGAQAGPPLLTPGGQCMGRMLTARYAWCPSPARLEDAFNEADYFYGVTFGEQGRASQKASDLKAGPSSLLSWDNRAIIHMALYQATCHEGLILRLVNPTAVSQPVSFTMGFSCEEVLLVNALEAIQQPLETPDTVLLPFSMQTFLFRVKSCS